MIIIPTRLCNTNSCSYCWVHKKDFNVKYFDNFNLEDFYEKMFFISNNLSDFNLRFFGWEPFLRFDVIKEIILYFKQKSDKFNFTINTNLTLLDEQKLDFIKENKIKLIISCNWNLKTHSKTRWIWISETLKLYKNIRKILNFRIPHQINVVVNNENALDLEKNLIFINKKLFGENINLLPVSYNWWTEIGLVNFEKSLNIISEKIKSWKLKINFINKQINNDVSLFNSEFVVDSDWKIYPSTAILEIFFIKEKEKILISDLSKNLDEIKKDLSSWEEENHKIYSLFINKVLKNKFSNIIENDQNSSLIFHNFLEKI